MGADRHHPHAESLPATKRRKVALMSTMTSSPDASTPAASVIRIPLPPPDKAKADKQPEPEAAPLSWLNNSTIGLLRALFPLSSLNGFDQDAPALSETKKRRPALKGEEKGEASRTIDRVLHATRPGSRLAFPLTHCGSLLPTGQSTSRHRRENGSSSWKRPCRRISSS